MSQTSTNDQQHPQYYKDRALVTSLMQADASEYNLAELARMKIRYRGFPGARDIQRDLEIAMKRWNYTEELLFEKTRQIHAKGLIYKQSSNENEDWI